MGAATTAEVNLSAEQAVTDAEGRAAVELTVNTLLQTKEAIEQTNQVEIFASLEPQCGAADPRLMLTIHRNEDVDAALGSTESPDDFATTLRPVIDLETWIVRQRQNWVTSNGARAVQQLLNQVACRRRGGEHSFLRPDGQFGNGSRAENEKFIRDFSAAPADGASAVENFEQRRFGVGVEENAAAMRGVKTYVGAEYGAYAEGDLVDGQLLVGPTAWAPGAYARIGDADGLLDLYRAVVSEFVERLHDRAEEYVRGARPDQTPHTWYRHPQDSGGTHNWPDTCSQGEAYSWGGARSLDEFHADLADNLMTQDDDEGHWLHYKRQPHSRIGLHRNPSHNIVVVPTAMHNKYNDLQNDSDIKYLSNEAQPSWQLRHEFPDDAPLYTGIDCSAFCQILCLEARFRAEHCADLADERMCRLLSEITHRRACWPRGKLSTRLWRKRCHYRRMPNRRWRREIAYRGDVLNVPGSHIVALATNDRPALIGRDAGRLWIWHANGTTVVLRVAAPHWTPTACIRRVVHSPLAQFASAWTSWGQATATVDYGRLLFWD